MMTIFGYSITALAPTVLLAFPVALGLLVYVFRRNGTSNQTVVSSLFLLRMLPQALPARRKFFPPMQFWLELLAILFLVAAGAGFVAVSTGQHVAVIIDSSMSMAAVDVSGGSRLDAAKRAAEEQIRNAPPASTFTVSSVAGSIRRIGASEIGAAEAIASVRSIVPRYEQDKLQSIVQASLSDPQFDAVWVYSDQFVDASDVPSLALRTTDVAPPQSRRRSINAWISELSLRVDDDQNVLSATLNNNSMSNLPVIVVAACRSSDLAPGSESALPSVNVTLKPKEPQIVKIPITSATWKACRVTTQLNAAAVSDDLPVDDTAWIVHGVERQQVTLVSSIAPEQLGLTKLSSLDLKYLPAAELNADTQPAGPAIYHRTVPIRRPDASTLIVFPPPGPLPWGGNVGTGDFRETVATRWLQSHPTTQYVNFPLLTFPAARSIQCPEGATETVSAANGAVVCLGEQRGGRYAVVGFELFPFDGIRTPTLSILTLNFLSWLFEQFGVAGASAPVGPLEQNAPSGDAAYILPVSAAVERTSNGTMFADHPGIIEVRDGNSRSSLIAINFSSTRESAIDDTLSFKISQTPIRADEEKKKSLAIYMYIAALGLLVLALDVMRRLKARQRWGMR